MGLGQNESMSSRPRTAPAAASSLDRLYDRPGFLLRRAHQISAAVFESECEAIGLTPAQYSVLSALRTQPGQDQSSLARALGFDKVTILRVLYGMEDRNLISRQRLPSDRRSMSLELTPEGSELFDRAQQPVDRAYRRLMAPFSDLQQKQFVKLLQVLVDELEDQARAPLVRTRAVAKAA